LGSASSMWRWRKGDKPWLPQARGRVLRRAPVEHIGDVNLASVESDRGEHPIEEPSGPPDEGKTLFVLVRPGASLINMMPLRRAVGKRCCGVRFSSQPSKLPSAALSSASVVQEAGAPARQRGGKGNGFGVILRWVRFDPPLACPPNLARREARSAGRGAPHPAATPRALRR
jgi:hypothetical protein